MKLKVKDCTIAKGGRGRSDNICQASTKTH